MVVYTCERCGHSFPKLWKFCNHQNRKFKCKPLSSTSQAQSTADIQTGQEANQAPVQLDNQRFNNPLLQSAIIPLPLHIQSAIDEVVDNLERERGQEGDSDYETADEGEDPETSRASPGSTTQAHREENKTEEGGLFSTITGVIRRWFGNLLSLTPKAPSWGNPTPPELPKPSNGNDTADEEDDFHFIKKGH